ncbi:MAG: hypothetical protein AB4368_30000 [Xenococcaceae cyanobacterium]
MKNSKLTFLTGKIALAILFFLASTLVKSDRTYVTKIDFGLSVANAQNIRPETAATRVYQLIPHLPQENQYLSRETGETDVDNTLISRLIRYHQYIKNRPLNYRLDWKLTLADYLGVNEPIRDFRYPGSSTLENNPLEGDRAVINSLSRLQRNELVNTLVGIYSGQSANNSPSNSPDDASPQPASSNPNSLPRLPQSGDAELLLP